MVMDGSGITARRSADHVGRSVWITRPPVSVYLSIRVRSESIKTAGDSINRADGGFVAKNVARSSSETTWNGMFERVRDRATFVAEQSDVSIQRRNGRNSATSV